MSLPIKITFKKLLLKKVISKINRFQKTTWFKND